MTLRQQIFEELSNLSEFGQQEEKTNKIIELTIQTINDLAAHSGKGFCVRTANRIRNKISETGQETSPEPNDEPKLKTRTFR